MHLLLHKVQSGSVVTKCFEVLCRLNKSTSLVGIVPGLLLQDSKFIDEQCDWSAATMWAQWWMQPRHLQMLHKDFSSMDNDVWDHCPADTNAVERKNQDSKDKIPQQLQSAMINLYKADKYMCTKHMAAMDGTSITYSDRSCEGCKKAGVSRSKHRAKKFESDPDAKHGPPGVVWLTSNSMGATPTCNPGHCHQVGTMVDATTALADAS